MPPFVFFMAPLHFVHMISEKKIIKVYCQCGCLLKINCLADQRFTNKPACPEENPARIKIKPHTDSLLRLQPQG
jgi:hypothetical protein